MEAMAMRNLVIRIAMWASAGFLVSAGWGFYFASTNKAVPVEPAIYALFWLTQPVVWFLDRTAPIGLSLVVVANAAAYALLGLIVETLRRRYRSLHISES